VQADDAYRYILYAAFGEEGGTVATTTPFGQAVLNVNEGEERVDYRIAIRNGRGVVGAGVYCTLPDGTQSKQILNLYGGTSASGALLITGSFVAHDIAETAHECEPAIETLEHLLQAVQEGEILFVVRYNREGEHHVTANLKITDYIAGFTIERHESDLAENMAETSDSSSSAQGIDIAQRNTSPLAMSVQSDNSISSGTTSNTSQNSIQTRQSMYWPFVAPNSHHVNRGGSIYFTIKWLAYYYSVCKCRWIIYYRQACGAA
jgi:hypothetical protein